MQQRTCVIAEDNSSERYLYAKMLTDHGFEVVGLATNGMELINLAREKKPDFILSDIEMPLKRGIEACAEIKDQVLPDVKIICTTGIDIIPNTFEIARSHINGYLLKGFNGRILIRAIKAVYKGEFFIDHLLHKKISRFPEFKTLLQIPELTELSLDPENYVLIEHEGEMVKVTDRHVLMVSAMYYSKRTEEIAASLSIEPMSVEQNIKRLKSRLNARDKMELVRIFIEYGLIDGTDVNRFGRE